VGLPRLDEVPLPQLGGVELQVKALDDLLIIRRGTGTPKEAVSGRADVVVGIDEWGRVVNVEIEFAEYYFQDAETAREILRKARW